MNEYQLDKKRIASLSKKTEVGRNGLQNSPEFLAHSESYSGIWNQGDNFRAACQ